ncbi:MAG: DUF371 domain-containing protein [Desulfurococcaceae archaeon]|nr:DUF371 domain-containing protein [Desulfurococcaceae archaeon]
MLYVSIPVYREKVTARGHQAIKAVHPTTFELTKDSYLTERGDCIIGVNLDKAVSELDPDFRKALKKSTSIVILVLRVDNLVDVVIAQGHEDLILSDDRRIIVRKSSYIDPATLAINANKSSRNIRRDLVEKLRDPQAVLTVDIYVLDLSQVITF